MDQNYLLIKIVKRLKPLFKKTDVDFEQMLLILRLKLTLDDRKNSNVESTGKIKGFKANLLMLMLVGIFMGILMPTPFDLFYKLALIASMDLFFMVMYMISDFTNVLLDTRDKHIVMTRPVTSITLNTAKMFHIVYYMLAMFLALNTVAIVIGVGIYGVKLLLAFLIMMITLPLLVVFATTILYSVLLEKFNGERLKDIINVFQIVVSIVSIVTYQILGRLFEFTDMNLEIHITWWTYLLPPVWYSGLFKVVVEGQVTPSYLAMAILAVAVPVVLGGLLIKRVLPKFEHYLSKLQMEDGLYVPKVSIVKKAVYGWVSYNQTERAFMGFADSNLSRDRKLKLMIYPNHAMALLFPFIILFSVVQSSGGVLEALETLKGSSYYMVLYLSVMFFITNFEFIQFSEKHEASFIYDSFPIENKRLILTGAAKTYYLKYVLPVLLVMSLVMLWLTGMENVLGIAFINISSLAILGLKVSFGNMRLPFSMEMTPGANKNLRDNFMFMGVVGGVAALHYFIIDQSLWFTGISFVIVLGLSKILFVKARVGNRI